MPYSTQDREGVGIGEEGRGGVGKGGKGYSTVSVSFNVSFVNEAGKCLLAFILVGFISKEIRKGPMYTVCLVICHSIVKL